MSAAVLYGVWRRRMRSIHVVTPNPPRHLKSGEIRFFRRRPRASEVNVLDGIPVTSFPRMLVDLCDILTEQQIAEWSAAIDRVP